MNRYITLTILVVMMTWAWWAYDLELDMPPPSQEISLIELHGDPDACGRSLVGIQPWMQTHDYQSIKLLYQKLDGYLYAAKVNGLLQPNAIVLFPEYLGTWMVIMGEKQQVADASTLTEAMTYLIMSNPVRFISHLRIFGKETDKAAAAIFRMKSEFMSAAYHSLFSDLSKEYGIFIVAGSIVLPDPYVKDGKLSIRKNGDLYNVTGVFRPDGQIDEKLVFKQYPISSEQPFTSKKPNLESVNFDLAGINAGILICADSWYPDQYALLDANTDLILVPSFCAGAGTMTMPWGGYDGGEFTADVDTVDVNQITEAEAWRKYALPGRISAAKVTYGMNVFLSGNLWDLGTDGQPFLIKEGKLLELDTAKKGGIWAVCLD